MRISTLRVGLMAGILASCVSTLGAWETVQTGTTASLRTIQFIGTDTGYVFGDAGTILKTVDGGASWTKPPFPPAPNANLGPAHFISGHTGWVVSDANSVYKTTNGGQNWVLLDSAPSAIGSLAFTNGANGWITQKIVDTLRIFATANGGSTWSLKFKTANALLSESYMQSYFSAREVLVSGDTGWIAAAYYQVFNGPPASSFQQHTGAGILIQTLDGGKSWEATPQNRAWKTGYHGGGSSWLLAGYPGKSLKGSACSPLGCGHCCSYYFEPISVNAIRHNYDGAASWQQTTINAGATQWLQAIHSSGSDTAIAVGTQGLIIRTFDGGLTWQTEAGLSGGDLYDVKFQSSTRAFAAGANGILLRTDPTLPFPVALRTNSTTAKNSGNLLNGVFHYSLANVSEVSIVLRDAMGRALWKFHGIEPPGNHSLKLPMDRLGSQFYLLEFRSDELHESRSFKPQ